MLRFEAPPHGLGTNIHYLTVLLSKAVQVPWREIGAEGTRALAMEGSWRRVRGGISTNRQLNEYVTN